MRTRKLVISIIITTVIISVLLMCIESYYVAIALIAGTLLIGYRELWSLITKRTLPPFDERVRENTGKSIRNGFVFLIVILGFLLLPFSSGVIERPGTVTVLGSLLISGSAMYFLSYIYYDRVEPKLTERSMKVFKVFLSITMISVPVFILSVFLHNLFDTLFGIEEAVFFIIAVIVAPAGLAIGLLGSAVMLIRGLLSRNNSQ